MWLLCFPRYLSPFLRTCGRSRAVARLELTQSHWMECLLCVFNNFTLDYFRSIAIMVYGASGVHCSGAIQTNRLCPDSRTVFTNALLGSSLRAWTGKRGHAKLCPHVADPATLEYKLYHRLDVKERIAEIQCEVHSRALMGIDEKRDLLRQMIEGTIPTKVNKRRDGTVEAVFDMLGGVPFRSSPETPRRS